MFLHNRSFFDLRNKSIIFNLIFFYFLVANGEVDPEATPLKDGDVSDDESDEDKSILQRKLDILTVQIGYIGTVACVATILVLLIRLIVEVLSADKYDISKMMDADGKELPQSDLSSDKRIKDNEVFPFSYCWLDYVSNALGFLIIGVTVLVVAIPEGLPLAVTISLAFSVKKMMKDNNLVRHLDSCETMGNATAICSDKTGTLTTNRMTVVQSFVSGKYFKDCSPNLDILPESIRTVLLQGIAINTNYTSKIMPSENGGEPQQLGNKTECALLGYLDAICKGSTKYSSTNYDKLRLSMPEKDFLKVYTFNSARKSMSTIIPNGNKLRMYTKGASEIIVKKCTSNLDAEGRVVNFSQRDRGSLQKKVIEPMAKCALRTIGLAYRDLEPGFDLEDEANLLNNLTLISIVGIEDPVREEVPRAIRKCQNAGICVRMVTGDNIVTARSIAEKCGIIGKDDQESLVLEGKFQHKKG